MAIEYSAIYENKCGTLSNKLQYSEQLNCMMLIFSAIWFVDAGETPFLRITK